MFTRLSATTILAMACLVVTPLLAQDDSAVAPSLRPVTGEDFRAVLSELEGQHVLVNLWASWCIPCIRELPDLQELQTTHDREDLRVITVTMDHPEERPAAEEIAAELTPTLDSYSNEDGYLAFPREAFSWQWDGTLPTTFLFDESGIVQRVFKGALTATELRSVEALVQPAPASDNSR